MQAVLVSVAVPLMLLSLFAPASAPPTQAQDPEGFTSEIARKASARYGEQIARLDEEYAAKFKKAGELYVKDLEEARKAALTRPDLDEAQRVLKTQTRVKAATSLPVPRRGFAILAARWGALTHWSDVTAEVRARIKESQLSLVPDQMGFPDPIDGTRKSLAVVYSMHGRIDLVTVGDGQPLELPPR
jgi:hypothetical protein